MATKLFVNLPVKDLNRSKAFFTELGLAFFGQAEDMASVIISEHTQVMLLTDTVFASYARNGVVDATASTEAILVLGVETRDQVDQLADRAEAAGGSPVGTPRDDGYRYQRGFTDLDGHHWEALCLIDPAGSGDHDRYPNGHGDLGRRHRHRLRSVRRGPGGHPGAGRADEPVRSRHDRHRGRPVPLVHRAELRPPRSRRQR